MTGFLLILAASLFVACAGLGVVLVHQWRRRHAAESELQTKIIEVTKLHERVAAADELTTALEVTRAENTALKQDQTALETRLEERGKAFREAEARFKEEFQRIANQTVSNAHDDFLKRAGETFEKFQTAALAQSDEKHTKIDSLLKPMKETLQRYEAGLRAMREAQNKEQGALTEQLSALALSTRHVQSEAAKLSTALRSSPGIRGQWGEMQLKNIVEAAGLSPYADFEAQKQIVTAEGGRGRPDLVVRLPGERVIAIDAKVSLNAYLAATDAENETERTAFLTKHADEVWQHVRSLSSRDYASGLKKHGALDFVVMFLGADSLLDAALEAQPQLLQAALDRGILIATPMTLVAMLKSVAYNWREENANANAREVAGLASDLYDRLCKMGTLLAELGGSLGRSVQKYNETIGSIEKRVMPQARKFKDYDMPGTAEKLLELTPVEADIRALQPGRDLEVRTTEAARIP